MLTYAFLFGQAAFAQTSVSTPIVANTHWTQEGGPYLLSGEIDVQGGASLTIDAGVTLYMAAGARFVVQAGSVRIAGTEAQPVNVYSDKVRQGQSAAPGDWDQWVFGPGTVNTQLDHVRFANGRGLAVLGSAPTLNFLDIRDQAGAAITIDLMASPAGVGIQATGNELNGIAVPAGDLSGTVNWGLRGIPYVVTSGTLSVGVSPSIVSLSPASIEQGQSASIAVNGVRLGGAGGFSFDGGGLAITPFEGGTSSQLFLKVDAAQSAGLGARTLSFQTDAGVVSLPQALTVTQPMPALLSISPSGVSVAAGPTDITFTGRNFNVDAQALFNGASVPTTWVSATQLRATLPNQSTPANLLVQVRQADPLASGAYLTSAALSFSVQAPAAPIVSVEPTVIAYPPDGQARQVTVRLSKPDYLDRSFNFAIEDATKATVSPSSAVIAAGQTSLLVTIVPKVAGTTSFVVTSAELGTTRVPLYITTDYAGLNTSYAKPVGVLVQGGTTSTTQQLTVANPVVGVAVGGTLSNVSPSGWTLGSTQELTVFGTSIPVSSTVELVPSAGVSVSDVVLNANGTELRFLAAAQSDATAGPRRVVVRDGSGKPLAFANPARAVVTLQAGMPSIDSVAPLYGLRGSVVPLVVRGRNLQQATVRLLPDTGLEVDSAPVIDADGTRLTLSVAVSADAPIGARVVQLQSPVGATSATASAANTFVVADSVGPNPVPLVSSVVGVTVGQAPPETAARLSNSGLVGVLTGAGVKEVLPRSGVIGTDVTVTVRGAGLQAVTSVGFVPAQGLSLLSSPSVNEAGTELQYTVRVAADASLGVRRLVLTAGGLPMTFGRPTDAAFLVSAPLPELLSVSPQAVLVGDVARTITVQGRNLLNVSAVRIEPSQDMVISVPVSVSATMLTFTASASTTAVPGVRTVIVTTPAGDSSAELTAGNMIHVASQFGPVFSGVASPVVGVNVGEPTSETVNSTLASAVVGVFVPTDASPENPARTVTSPSVGIAVGSAVRSMAPAGWLQGTSDGSIVLTGFGLDTAASVVIKPSAGLVVGSPVVGTDGTQVSVPLSVAPAADLGVRRLQLLNAAGGELMFVEPAKAVLGIGVLPTMSSLSPLNLAQGSNVNLLVRGSNLKGVLRVVCEPADGVSFGAPIWSSDALGELLTVPVAVDAGSPLGARVLRLEVYGGSTTATPSAANTLTVIRPQ